MATASSFHLLPRPLAASGSGVVCFLCKTHQEGCFINSYKSSLLRYFLQNPDFPQNLFCIACPSKFYSPLWLSSSIFPPPATLALVSSTRIKPISGTFFCYSTICSPFLPCLHILTGEGGWGTQKEDGNWEGDGGWI